MRTSLGPPALLILLLTAVFPIFSCSRWEPVLPSPPLPERLGPEAGPSPAPAVPPAPPEEPLAVTIEEAVLMALENNRALRVERLVPQIQRTYEEEERAVFDPMLEAEIGGFREKERRAGEAAERADGIAGGAGVSERLPTGTTLELDFTGERNGEPDQDDEYSSRVGLSVTQALLKGFGPAANLASLRQARLDSIWSDYEFRGLVENLVAEVETTYWRYVLARRGGEIVQQSLELAQQQLVDTRHRIRVGQLAETELAAAEAEVALRREALINAHSIAEALRVRLLRLISPSRLAQGEGGIAPETEPLIPSVPLDPLEDHIALALRLRPDLNQARLLLQRGELEVVKTGNGLLPRLDLFIALGKTGYAGSFGDSLDDLDGDSYDLFAGLEFEFPPANRSARARKDRADLTLRQRRESLDNLNDLARQDVELALIEVNRARQQVDATAITRKFQEEKLRAETAKFRVGKSTALLVAAAQRDLLDSQVAEVEAVTNNLNARINLFLLEGSLLDRRGLAAPGREPETGRRIGDDRSGLPGSTR